MAAAVPMTWRAMEEGDLPAVNRIGDVVHVDYPEAPEVIAERLALYPAGCRLACIAGEPVGYALMHPGRVGEAPPLDTLLGGLPADADCLYLHDIALLPAARGSGLGSAVLAEAEALARAAGFAMLALTSTPPARGYWLRQGFQPTQGGPALQAKLASYGAGMTYMTRPVD